jgi:hypothetical protein
MSNYIKSRADQKRKINKEYRDRLFTAASLVLPSVVMRSPDDASSAEMVDTAILIARDLLADLDYTRIGGEEDEI